MRLTYKARDQYGKETGTIWYASTAGDSIFPKSDKEEQVLKKLAAYEDTGFEPEEIDFCLSGAISPQEAKERYEAHKKHYDEWFAWKQADEQGLLVRLPCKIGDTVYEIDLPEYGVIVCNVLCFTYGRSNITGELTWCVAVEVIEGHGLRSCYTFDQDDFGKTVFLTREEAESALKEDYAVPAKNAALKGERDDV